MIGYLVLFFLSIVSIVFLCKLKNIKLAEKIILSLICFGSLFVIVLSLTLTFTDFSFKSYLWKKWACFDEQALNDSFQTVRKIDLLGYDRKGFTIRCQNPLEYTVKINSLGVRSTPPDPKDWSKINVALMGCSYTWGTGLNEDETISYYLQSLKKDSSVVNFGVPGGSPSAALRFLELVAMRKLPVGTIDNVVYTIRDGHYVRNTGKGRWLFHPRNPQYEIVDDSVEYINTFSVNNDINYENMDPIDIVMSFFRGVYHLYKTNEAPADEDVIFTAKIINKMYDVSTENLRANFVLNIWPESNKAKASEINERRKVLVENLNKSIKVIHLNEKLSMMVKGRHPTSESTKKMANFINETIVWKKKKYENKSNN